MARLFSALPRFCSPFKHGMVMLCCYLWLWSSFDALAATNNSRDSSTRSSSTLASSMLFRLDDRAITSQYSIENWTNDDGLPNNSVQGIAQTEDGYLWLGTFNGLVRFDGVALTVFTTLPLNAVYGASSSASGSASNSTSSTIRLKPIEAVMADSKGRLWVSLQWVGLLCIEQGRTTLFTKQSGLSSSMVYEMKELPDGSLLLTTRDGLDRLSFDGGVAHISHDTAINEFIKQAGHSYPSAVLHDTQGDLWVGTPTGLCWRTAQGVMRFFVGGKAATSNENDGRTSKQNGLVGANIKCLLEDRNHDVWIGTDEGICIWKRAEHKMISGAELQAFSPFLPSSPSSSPQSRASAARLDAPMTVWDMCEDREGRIWIGSSKGLWLWSPYEPPALRLRQLSKEDGLPDNSVRRVMVDKEGSIWLGSYYAGLIRLKRGVFTNYTAREGLPFDVLYAMLHARDGSYWLAGFGGLQHVSPSGVQNFTTDNGLTNDLVRSLAEGTDGAVWVATYGGLHRIHRGKIQVWTVKDGLPDNQIRAVHVARDGAVWIGMTRGLCRFAGGAFTTFSEAQGLPQANCVCIYESRDGSIWVSTAGSGVYVLPQGRTDAQFKPKFKHYGVEQGLSAPVAFAFYEDRATGDMWVAANGGINRMRGDSVVTLSKRHGLPDEDVFNICEDGKGQFWMTCNIGIIRVARREVYDVADGKQSLLQCKLYTRADGMATSNCTVPSQSVMLADGRLYCMTLKGLTILDPQRITKNLLPPSVVIENVITETSQPDRAGTASHTKQYGLNTSLDVNVNVNMNSNVSVEIPPGRSTAEIHYTALSFLVPERVMFQYKLDGVDKDWVQAGTRRVAYYTNLKPGQYTFHVKACNNDGIWNEREAALALVLRPYFYQTIWFYALCGVVTVVLLGAGHRYRTWRLHARAEELKRLVAERTAALEASNGEIQRQLFLLDEQAGEIELFNSQLQENNLRLEEANHELTEANSAIVRQQAILEAQAADIELTNAELHERNARLELLNQEKNEFLGIASHDLKNPLSAIQMTASMLHDYYDRWTREAVLERLQSIVTSSKRMSAIITNLLDINAIEAGKFNLQPELFDLTTLVHRIVEEYRERAAAKGITLHCQSDADETAAFADVNATVEVLDNLISNAIKYSPHDKRVFVSVLSDGAVVFECYERSQMQPRIGCVLVVVRDEGPGLSEEDKAQLFGKFARLSAKPTGGEHSTGLGLSIVKKITEAMNGRVWCASQRGHGAEFIVEFPAQGEQEQAQEGGD